MLLSLLKPTQRPTFSRFILTHRLQAGNTIYCPIAPTIMAKPRITMVRPLPTHRDARQHAIGLIGGQIVGPAGGRRMAYGDQRCRSNLIISRHGCQILQQGIERLPGSISKIKAMVERRMNPNLSHAQLLHACSEVCIFEQCNLLHVMLSHQHRFYLLAGRRNPQIGLRREAFRFLSPIPYRYSPLPHAILCQQRRGCYNQPQHNQPSFHRSHAFYFRLENLFLVTFHAAICSCSRH